MTTEERAKEAAQVADFRYAIIAEVANPYLNREERRRLLREKARVEYDVPRLGRRRLSVSCLRKWLRLYLTQGKAGLLPHPRSDTGTPRSLSAEEAALLLNHLESRPELCATVALRTLQKEGRILSDPSTSSLSRLVRTAGMERQKRMRLKDGEQNLKFDFDTPLECVQADGLYTVAVADPKGKRRQAILLVFLDDATRRVVFAGFAFSENSLLFERGIKHILLSHGRIGKLYADNGSAFISGQTQRILDTLGITLVHSRPGKPAGRGKVERFFRTVREQFLRPLEEQGLKNLEDLDIRFHTWLESEYHRSPHRGLSGKTPLEAWVEKASSIIPVDPSGDYPAVFLHEASRKVYKDSTITLDGVLYEVPSTLIGERISLFYDPFIPAQRRQLLIRRQGHECGLARMVDSYANTKVRRSYLLKDPVVEQAQEPRDEAQADAPPSPLDAGLSASRIRLDEPESEVSA
jgi:transposase InsO family protein